jgi:diadenosine tetraphosphatase ApaH/serine/threonine PP2A family protein phosphatase
MDAFEAVLRDIEQSGADEIICLGDNIGYGAEPDAVIRTVMERNIPTVLGNHELAAVNRKRLGWFNPSAKMSLEITFQMLSQASTEFISGLPFFLLHRNYRFVHGFPPDLPMIYLFQIAEKKLVKTFQNMTEEICFVGHTHELKVVGFDGTYIEHIPLSRHTAKLKLRDSSRRYIINVGSVGQPRDGSSAAKYVIWNIETRELEVRFVAYDVAYAAHKIIQAGMPATHAERLWG